MKRLLYGALFGVAGYCAATVVSYVLVNRFSSNTHDKSVEAAMTSAFFYGPIGAVCGIVAGVMVGGRRASSPQAGG